MRLAVGEEVVAKRAFAWAIDWPGWCRAGKTPELARLGLAAYQPRYASVARIAGLLIPDVGLDDLVLVASVEGGSGTAFGVPSSITDLDRLPTDAADAERVAALVTAAWAMLDRIAATAPQALRKGPRGGGRDRDKVVEHVVGADHAYAHEIGIRLPSPEPADRAAVEAEREAMLEILRAPSDGSPLADRRWPARYAARRIAWHALDHAWEIEDRAEPEPAP